MIHKCPFCQSSVHKQKRCETQTYHLGGPWPAKYQVDRMNCPPCGVPIVHQSANFDHGYGVTWNGWSESMIEGTDYEVIGIRHGGCRLDGTTPLNAAWAFHPMPNDNERWLPKIIEQVAQDEAFKQPCAKLLIIPPGFDASRWTTLLRMYFNEAWQLKPHLMLGSGTLSPYPAVRAELSILKTLATHDLDCLRHYWPSASLNPNNYRPMADDHTLREAWSAYARNNINLHLKKEKP